MEPRSPTDVTEEERDPLLGAVVAGRFEVVDFIARGGMGAVYRAVQRGIEREVALKVLMRSSAFATVSDRSFEERFRREAATYGKLRHPNTVTLHDFGTHDLGGQTLYFMAMELVQGRTLADLLVTEGRFAPSRVIALTLQVLASLREAHALGIVHRDLKPGNLMLVRSHGDEHVKVLDFGVAKMAGDDTQRDHALTGTGTLLGSPLYMAPEQIRGEPIDARTDIYALGVILFELLTGQPPFQGAMVFDVCAKHLTKPVPTLASVVPGIAIPPELEAVLRTCLEKDPQNRYASVDALANALRVLQGATDVGTIEGVRMPAVTPSPRPPVWRSPLAWFLVLLITGTGASVVGVGLIAVVAAVVSAGTDAPTDADPVPTRSADGASDPTGAAPPEARPLLQSEPPGAEVWRDDTLLGATPLALPREGLVTLRLAGHEALVIDLAMVVEDEAIALVRLPAAPADTLAPAVDAAPEPSPPVLRPAPDGFKPHLRTER